MCFIRNELRNRAFQQTDAKNGFRVHTLNFKGYVIDIYSSEANIILYKLHILYIQHRLNAWYPLKVSGTSNPFLHRFDDKSYSLYTFFINRAKAGK